MVCERKRSVVRQTVSVSYTHLEIHALAAGTDGTLWIYRRTDLYTDDGEMVPSLSELIQLDAHGTLRCV